jgi:hypothetical protein
MQRVVFVGCEPLLDACLVIEVRLSPPAARRDDSKELPKEYVYLFGDSGDLEMIDEP